MAVVSLSGYDFRGFVRFRPQHLMTRPARRHRALNEALLRRRIEGVMRRLGFRDVVTIVGTSFAARIAGSLGEGLGGQGVVVYDCNDDWASMPGYVRAMDVCVLAYRRNAFTASANPTKVFESHVEQRLLARGHVSNGPVCHLRHAPPRVHEAGGGAICGTNCLRKSLTKPPGVGYTTS